MIAAYLLVCSVALGVAVLTFFSGFGLGTLLMPAFAAFFPIEVAIAATAVVHLANNLFKTALVGRRAEWSVVARFGLASAVGALGGAWALARLARGHEIATYALAGHEFHVTVTGLTVGALIVVFGALEFSERLERLDLPRWSLPIGGLLSGFFGGLSGHQGALRSAFLARAGMSKEQLVGTRAVCAVIVDSSRLLVYGLAFLSRGWDLLRAGNGVGLVVAATIAAFAGSLLGTRLLRAVTLEHIRRAVGALLLIFGTALAAGLV